MQAAPDRLECTEPAEADRLRDQLNSLLDGCWLARTELARL